MNKWYLGQTQPYQLKDLPYNWVLDWDLTGTSSGGTFLSGNAYLCKPNQTDHCILFFRPNQTTSNYNRTVKWSFAWDLTGTSSGGVMLGSFGCNFRWVSQVQSRPEFWTPGWGSTRVRKIHITAHIVLWAQRADALFPKDIAASR